MLTSRQLAVIAALLSFIVVFSNLQISFHVVDTSRTLDLTHQVPKYDTTSGAYEQFIAAIDSFFAGRNSSSFRDNASHEVIHILRDLNLDEAERCNQISLLLSGTVDGLSREQYLKLQKLERQLHDHSKNKRDEWYMPFVKQYSRVWSHQPLNQWCFPEVNATTLRILPSETFSKGMIYIKIYKASSSTGEGVTQSILHRVGKRLFNQPCIGYTRHEFADYKHHAGVIPSESLLWTFVRHPAQRDLSSMYHFEVARFHNIDPNNVSAVMEFLEKEKSFQTKYLNPRHSKRQQWPRVALKRHVQGVMEYINLNILHKYDFLGVTDRMMESLAVMVLLWDLDPRDVIVLSSKVSGGYDAGGYKDICTLIPKERIINEELQFYFDNNHSQLNADYFLYHVANEILDRTINNVLGKDAVDRMLLTLKRLQKLAVDKCQDKAIFPCSANGTIQLEQAEKSCYLQDAGCGHECVEMVLESSWP